MAKRGENIYKRKDGRYEGRYIKGRCLEGKPRFGYVYGYTYAEVKSALTLVKAASRQDISIHIIGKGTLTDFLKHWLERIVRQQVKDSTYAQYYERITNHILPALGGIPVCSLSTEQIQRFINALSERGLSPSTIRNIAGLLSSAMKKAIELNLTHANPCAGLALPQTEAGERRALDRTEQIRLERLLPQSERSTELGVLLALYTGLRIGELCALRWRDIDLFSGTLTVRGTLQRVKNLAKNGPKTILSEGTPKSKRSLRRIPLPPGLADKLRRRGEGISDGCYVLTAADTPIEPHTLRMRFKKLAGMAGLDITFHCLRHTFVTRCLELNFDMQTVSELLGHATAGVTMSIYAHSVFEHKRMLAERLHILSECNEPSNEPSGYPA